ncbi:MAG: autotransporter outer membrane beta-barrel domain-containing protein [Rhodobacteraceae bacterium]|nr:autotransporter outer membrane beta-barrel domain-containing protein [Paracoccaceae bacterium]
MSRRVSVLTLSTASAGPNHDRAWDAWFRVGYSHLDGTSDGDAFNATAGLEFDLGESTDLGVVASYSDIDLTSSGVRMESKELSFGPYLSHQVNDLWSLNAFLVYGRPDRDIGGASYRSDRFMGGLGVSVEHTVGAVEFTSFGALSGISDAHPAATISGTAIAAHSLTTLTGSLGTKAAFDLTPDLRSFVSFTGSFSHSDDGFGTTSTHFGPRVGGGLTYDGGAGALQLDVSAGEITDGTRAYSIGLGYNLQF